MGEIDAGQTKEQDVPLTSIAFTNFFRCLLFDHFFFTNADVTIKDETSNFKLTSQYTQKYQYIKKNKNTLGKFGIRKIGCSMS